MKIEKVNENQIRCTLTREDLASRELKISELAYGTEKAKSLFRDMMQQANFEFGFEAEDIPLMIEAIPLNADCIVLIITKVEDPEELDTRFSRFAPSVTEDSDEGSDESTADEVLDLFRRIQMRSCSRDSRRSRSRGKRCCQIPPVPYGISETGDQRGSNSRKPLSRAQHSVSRGGHRRVLSDPDAGRRRSRGLRPCLQCHL